MGNTSCRAITDVIPKIRQSRYLIATIYLRANATHVFIFTTCFGCNVIVVFYRIQTQQDAFFHY
jgi:hypothetical protein